MAGVGLNDGHQDGHQGGAYRRIELITGEARRRRWSAEEKAEILAESFEPGARVSEVALRHGVNRGLLWAWRHEVRKSAAAGPTFVALRIADEAAGAQSPAARGPNAASATAAAEVVTGAAGTIEIKIGKVQVRVSGTVDAAALQQVLAHLGRAQ